MSNAHFSTLPHARRGLAAALLLTTPLVLAAQAASPASHHGSSFGLPSQRQSTTITTFAASVCNRTAAVRDAITAAAGKSTCGAVTGADLAGITALDVNDASLTSLQADDFDGLSALTSLRLDGNSLSSLPSGVFDRLGNLGVLLLFNNSLSSLPSGVFDRNARLFTLRLDGNSLTSLPTGVFDNNTSLSRLILSGNSGLACLPYIPASVTELGLDQAESAYAACGARVTVGARSVTVGAGATKTYSVELRAYPRGDVTVTPVSSATSTVAVAGALTFTQSNWRTAQSVGVTGVAAGTGTVSHTVSGGGYDSATAADVAVTVTSGTLAASAVTASTATLTLSGHAGSWHLKQTAPTTGACSAAIDTSSTSVDDLSASTTYTFAAYSDGGCATLVGSESFTTLSDGGDHGDGGDGDDRGGGGGGGGGGGEGASVLGFALASDPGIDGRYTAGEEIVFAVTFTKPVRTTGDGPTLKFTVGGKEREAAYADGSETATLRFRYVLAAGDAGSLAVPADALADSAGTIQGLDGLAAALDAEAATLARQVGVAQIPLLPRAATASGRQGFVRVINHSAEAGEVSITAVDNAGTRLGPVTLSIGANASRHLNSADLENGNTAKGLSGGVGPGEGGWRLEVVSALDVEAIGYIRHADGFLTAMNSLAPRRDGAPYVATFNPGSNYQQVSRLRLFNAGGSSANVRIAGTDDGGRSPGGAVALSLAAGAAAGHIASALESGSGVAGALGDGAGKWRLAVEAPPGVAAMSLMRSPSGHLTNLSTAPAHRHGDALIVPLFLSASDPWQRQGFVRVVNRSASPGTVHVEAFDDSAWDYDPVQLRIDPGAVFHFNSDDLELGNPNKILVGSTGPASAGDWWLRLVTDIDIEVLAYVRHADGFLTSMHDVAPKRGGVHRVATFNPASNTRQVSLLRIVNLDAQSAAQVTIRGIDGDGVSPGTDVTATVPARRSLTLDAKVLEEGGEDFAGALGDGAAKWRLQVESEQDILVMSLMQSPTGHLSNLSARPMAAD